MEKFESLIKKLVGPDKEIVAIALIEGRNNFIYSTPNWDIEQYIDHINEVWESKKSRNLELFGEKYIVLQNTKERLIASSVKTSRRRTYTNEGIVGFKNENFRIISKIPAKKAMNTALMDNARVLSEISGKEPYIPKDEVLKGDKLDELNPNVLSDTSRILEKLGLKQVGLSLDDAKVYLALLEKGEKGEKVGNLNKELDLKRTHIYRIIDRLEKNDWVEKIAKTPKGVQLYAARSLTSRLDNFIREKEEELKILKGIRLILGESKEGEWNIISKQREDLKKQFDLDIQEIMGVEKDCGIVVFEYDKIIMDEENLDKVKLRIYSEKLENSILERKDAGKLNDLNEVKTEEVGIKGYPGAILSIKFKKGSKTAGTMGEEWIVIVKMIAIPIDNKIYLIWGSEEKFELLMNMILRIG